MHEGSRRVNPVKRRSVVLRRVSGRMALGVCMAALWVIAPVTPMFAESGGAAERVVQGKAVDKADAAIKGAVVYLKDDHSLAVKSYITDDQGGYRFGQLAQNTDYELWAESNGKKSPVKTISSFDSKRNFYINLKVDK